MNMDDKINGIVDICDNLTKYKIEFSKLNELLRKKSTEVNSMIEGHPKASTLSTVNMCHDDISDITFKSQKMLNILKEIDNEESKFRTLSEKISKLSNTIRDIHKDSEKLNANINDISEYVNNDIFYYVDRITKYGRLLEERGEVQAVINQIIDKYLNEKNEKYNYQINELIKSVYNSTQKQNNIISKLSSKTEQMKIKKINPNKRDKINIFDIATKYCNNREYHKFMECMPELLNYTVSSLDKWIKPIIENISEKEILPFLMCIFEFTRYDDELVVKSRFYHILKTTIGILENRKLRNIWRNSDHDGLRKMLDDFSNLEASNKKKYFIFCRLCLALHVPRCVIPEYYLLSPDQIISEPSGDIHSLIKYWKKYTIPYEDACYNYCLTIMEERNRTSAASIFTGHLSGVADDKKYDILLHGFLRYNFYMYYVISQLSSQDRRKYLKTHVIYKADLLANAENWPRMISEETAKAICDEADVIIRRDEASYKSYVEFI